MKINLSQLLDDGHIRSLFDAIRQLMAPPEPTPRRIGFRAR
ncbi:MAG: hypothetical protein Q7R68_04240 [Nitrospirales bacterium]|nr:hypothetical protein [Nitrospirales bacterium]